MTVISLAVCINHCETWVSPACHCGQLIGKGIAQKSIGM